ncbi:peptidase M23 [Clostridia bacterium]|nr:peptidase M23 [Clostridia bacterium]
MQKKLISIFAAIAVLTSIAVTPAYGESPYISPGAAAIPDPEIVTTTAATTPAYERGGDDLQDLDPAELIDTSANDKRIAELEAKQKRLEEENAAREKRIQALKGDKSKQDALAGEVEKQVEGIQEQVDYYGQLITQKNYAIGATENSVRKTIADIESREREIELRIGKIAALEKENEDNMERFGDIIRAMYIEGQTDTFSVLMGSADFYDLLVRTEILKNTSRRNVEFMDSLKQSVETQKSEIEGLKQAKIDLENQKAALIAEEQRLENQKVSLASEKSVVDQKVREQQDKLNDLEKISDSIAGQIQNLHLEAKVSSAEVEKVVAEISAEIARKQAILDAGLNPQTDYSGDGLKWPLDGTKITTKYGYDAWRGGTHHGIDITKSGGSDGLPIYAAQSGTVLTAYGDGDYHGGYGNYVVISHGGPNKLSTLYAHMSSSAVSEGQEVTKGQVIGYVGKTGWATGPHLHFEVWVNGRDTDPLGYVSAP